MGPPGRRRLFIQFFGDGYQAKEFGTVAVFIITHSESKGGEKDTFLAFLGAGGGRGGGVGFGGSGRFTLTGGCFSGGCLVLHWVKSSTTKNRVTKRKINSINVFFVKCFSFS
jgi:hypothetical protein